MAIVIGVAGNSGRVKAAMDRYMWPALLIALLSLVFAPFVIWSLSAHPGIAASILLFMLVVTALLFAFRSEYREVAQDFIGSRRWLQGAEGEAATGAVLAKLPDTYVVFNDYNPQDSEGNPVDWNLDHVVIGPTGVFVVETKNYRYRRVEPAAKSPFTCKNVKQTDGNSIAFKRSLITWSGGAMQNQFVQPLLVYVQPKAFIEQVQEGRVKVIPLKWLEGDITGRTGNELDPDAVSRIARVLYSKLRWEYKEAAKAEFSRLEAASKQLKVKRVEERVAARASGQVSQVPMAAQATSELPQVCPLCSGQLVRRKASRGPRAGKYFLGCANYRTSRCRYVLNLDD
ncbi:MAG: nuclease-related domain-containing protein [Coriobacteriia bacterium]